MSVGGTRIRVARGDITRIPVDAMVNAANSALAGGGGVDGAIHRAGGPSLMQELDVIRAREGGCSTGSAVVTGAGKLPAKWVFHAVGPIYQNGRNGEPGLLAGCYGTCLKLAEQHGARTISFPAISTGIYGYPAEEAAEIAVREVSGFLEQSDAIDTVIFVVFDSGAEKIYQRLLAPTRNPGPD
jgi:O-acetyl-ADP-ribose deacetylase (regulator of RNase III)